MKRHGPSLHIERLELVPCRACHGRGIVRPLFHEMPCAACHGSGRVAADGRALEPIDLIVQLRACLDLANARIRELGEKRRPAGPGADYEGRKNTHHRGGGNWTGD